MSQARTPKDRRWVQIELPVNGKKTGFIQVDLNMVDKVTVTRHQEKEDDFELVQFVYAGTMQPVTLGPNNAKWFFQIWMDYLKEHDNMIAVQEAAEGKDNLIFIPTK